MNKSKKFWLKKPIPIVAAFSVFVCFSVVCAAAVKNGFFKDVTRGNGTVVGTTYEQASEEIDVNVTVADNELLVFVTMLSPDKSPYSEFEEFGINSYQITDMSGNVVIKDAGTELFQVTNGQAEIKISLEGIESGSYQLVIHQYVGSAKANQPLEINGTWKCEFET